MNKMIYLKQPTTNNKQPTTKHCHIQEFFDHLLIRHEFIKRLYKRYKLEGITIPFPIQNIYLEDFKPQMNADERR